MPPSELGQLHWAFPQSSSTVDRSPMLVRNVLATGREEWVGNSSLCGGKNCGWEEGRLFMCPSARSSAASSSLLGSSSSSSIKLSRNQASGLDILAWENVLLLREGDCDGESAVCRLGGGDSWERSVRASRCVFLLCPSDTATAAAQPHPYFNAFPAR